jgi:predicted thioesterase
LKNITTGTVASVEISVNKESLAVNVGSGSLEVFATPVMVMLMEKSACKCIAQFLENDETTVGTEINVKHISATPEAANVKAMATVIAVNGREIEFNVEAFDNAGKIGEGTHKRFVVNSGRFTEKAKSKLN